MMGLAVFLAVLGAFFLAFGAQRQGSAVKADTGGLGLSSNGFIRLLRNPRWLLGVLLLRGRLGRRRPSAKDTSKTL